MISIANIELSYINLTIVVLSLFVIGLTRGGIHGLAIITLPFFAEILGAKSSSGYVVLFFLCGDIIAVIRYYKNANFKLILKLLPLALVGIATAGLTGAFIPEKAYKVLLTIIVVYSMISAIRATRKPLKTNPITRAIYGFTGGFASMIGNIAGTLMTGYFLSLNIPKKNYLGTYTLFFACLNFLKVLIHIFVWKTITPQVVKFDLILLPIMLLGVFVGFAIAKKIEEKIYRKFLLIIMFFSCLQMVLSTINSILLE